MLLPLSDESPMQRFPVATVAIILANVATWVLVHRAFITQRQQHGVASVFATRAEDAVDDELEVDRRHGVEQQCQ